MIIAALHRAAAPGGTVYVVSTEGAETGFSFLSAFGSSLVQLTESQARALSPSSVPAGSRVLFVISPKEPAGWASSRDRFVPQLEKDLSGFASNPNVSKVVVVISSPDTPSPWFADELVPLVTQASREAGATILEGTGNSALMKVKTADSLLDWATFTKGWKVVSVDSFQKDEGEPENAIDGDPSTYWHTEYDPAEPKYPHELTVDTGKIQTFAGFRYLPRQDGGTNGLVGEFKLEVSTDGQNWTETSLNPETIKGRREAVFAFDQPITARYYRFTALKEQGKGPWASGAEIELVP